jgi:hypothetical protein
LRRVAHRPAGGRRAGVGRLGVGHGGEVDELRAHAGVEGVHRAGAVQVREGRGNEYAARVERGGVVRTR